MAKLQKSALVRLLERAVVLILMLIPGVVVFGSLGARIAEFNRIVHEHEAWLKQTPIPGMALVGMATLSEVGIFVVFGVISVLLYSRKQDDKVAVFVAIMLANTGAVILHYTDPMAWLPLPLRGLFVFTVALATASAVSFVIAFPATRHIPLIIRGSAYLWCIIVALWYGIQVFSPDYTFPPKFVPPALMIAGIVNSLLFQIYRYVILANGTERQQAKWVVYGTTCASVGFLLYQIGLPLIFPSVLEVGLPRLFYIFAGLPIAFVAVSLMPLSIAFAVLRYRLWEIDRFVNRALVYGTLTGGLVLVFIGGVTVLQQIFRLLTGSRSVWAIVLATVAIAKLVEPLRIRLQGVIDMRFYRERHNAALVFTDYSIATRDEIDINRISQKLISAVEQSVHPTQISLWVRANPAPNRRAQQVQG